MGFPCRFKSDFPHHIETIGLMLISVLFSFYRAISLILGINCLILGEVAFFFASLCQSGKQYHESSPVCVAVLHRWPRKNFSVSAKEMPETSCLLL